MAARLAALREGGDPRQNAFTPERMVELLDDVEEPPDLRSQVALDGRRARARLLAGRTTEAVAQLDGVLRSIEEHPELFKPGFVDAILELAAIAALRLGEEQNCLDGHTSESCLLPIEGGGVHHRQEGARRAIELYRRLLDRRPEDLEARWLLNVAVMAVGEYPEGVAERWRISPELFASEADFPRFHDVAPALGLDAVGLSGGVVVEDLDGDLLLDVMVSSWGLGDPIRVFRNRGADGFEEVTADAGLDGITGGLNLVHADYDNDGDADVLVLRGAWLGPAGHHPNSLLENRSRDGRIFFADVTETAGLLAFHPTQTAA
jgi:hypothetical protein